MKKTTKKASPARKLLPAAASLLISAAMLSTSTYAWFTMNKHVSVTGMTMRTRVSGNLLISDNNMEADYTTSLSQTRAALLEPVSSINGEDGSFFYTLNATGNGAAIANAYVDGGNTDTYKPYSEATALGASQDIIANSDSSTAGTHPTTAGAGKTNYAVDFNTDYGIGTKSATANVYENAYGYVDYVFYLKATGDGTDTQVKLTKLNLLYNNGAVTNGGTVGADVDKAWRVGVFCSDITASKPGTGVVTASNATASGEGTNNLKAILTLSGAANQTTGKAVDDEDGVDNLQLAYNTWSDATNTCLGTVADTATAYYKVTLRVWLEGEDTTCTSKTYAQLTNNWTLDAEFDLTHNSAGESDTTAKAAVTNIGSSTT